MRGGRNMIDGSHTARVTGANDSWRAMSWIGLLLTRTGGRVQGSSVSVTAGVNVRSLQCLVAASLLSASTCGLAAAAAEFSIRWDPDEGGPNSVKESLATLNLKQGKHDDFVVQYFAVNQPSNAPADSEAIARERRRGHHVEATYKSRGPARFPADPSYLWKCPLKGPEESKTEVDITWTGDALPRRAYSQSCTANADMAHAMPTAYGAKPLGCTSKMHRFSDSGVTLEHWELPSGKQVFEASVKGVDSASDLKAFEKRIVSPLLDRGVRPLKDSKTELGSSC
jgi:hypothetical protein